MPSAQDVADLADCSLRTVYVHFSDMGALTCAAFDSAVLAALPSAPEGSADRLGAFLAAYSATAEKWHGLWSLLLAVPSAEAERTVDRMHEAVRVSLRQAFGPDLTHRSPAELASALVLLESVLDFAVWRRMRERDGMSVPRAQAAWGEMIAAILARVPSLSA
jgi:AcrR family transcriptional regulator